MVKRKEAVALGAVQQGVDHHQVGALGGTLQPEGAEDGEFLAAGIGCLDGKAARRDAVALAFGDGAEIAGAEEGGDLVRPSAWFSGYWILKPAKPRSVVLGGFLPKLNRSGLYLTGAARPSATS